MWALPWNGNGICLACLALAMGNTDLHSVSWQLVCAREFPIACELELVDL